MVCDIPKGLQDRRHWNPRFILENETELEFLANPDGHDHIALGGFKPPSTSRAILVR